MDILTQTHSPVRSDRARLQVDGKNATIASEYFMGTPMDEIPWIDDVPDVVGEENKFVPFSAYAPHVIIEGFSPERVPFEIATSTPKNANNLHPHSQFSPISPYQGTNDKRRPTPPSTLALNRQNSPPARTPLLFSSPNEQPLFDISVSTPTRRIMRNSTSTQDVLSLLRETAEALSSGARLRHASGHSVGLPPQSCAESNRASVLMLPGMEHQTYMSVGDYQRDEEIRLQSWQLKDASSKRSSIASSASVNDTSQVKTNTLRTAVQAIRGLLRRDSVAKKTQTPFQKVNWR